MGKAATSPLPSWGSPMLCRGTNLKWPTKWLHHKWAKWLHHPCLLGGPQCSTPGSNLKWPTSGESGYITPAFLGVPNALHGDKAATSPLPSQGSPVLCTGNKSEMAHKFTKRLQHPCLLGGPQCSAQGTTLKWPTNGQSGYITPAFSVSPMLCTGNQSEKAHKWA